MKTRKRLFAIVLALCLVLSMTVPVAWAEETIGTAAYYFGPNGFDSENADAYNSKYFGTNGNLVDEKYKIENTNGEAVTVEQYIADKYAAGTLNWKFEANKKGETGINVAFNGKKYLQLSLTSVGDWSAVRVKAPSAGEYQVKFTFGFRCESGKVDIYLLPMSEGETFTEEDINKATPLISSANLNNGGNLTSADLETTPYWTCDKNAKEFILVFKVAEDGLIGYKSGTSTLNRAHVYLQTLKLEPVVSVDGEKSTDLSTALDDAKAASDKTVKLLANYDAADITVPAGVTLDLNGYKLTADSVQSAGAIIDSTDGDGLLVMDSDMTNTSPDNGGYLPLYDNAKSGYRFFKGGAKTLGHKDGTSTSVSFWFTVEMSGENAKTAYELINNGKSKLSIKADLTVNGNTYDVDFVNFVQDFGNKALNAPVGKTAALYLNVINLGEMAGKTVTLKPIVSCAGVSVSNGELTYTVPTAA